MKKWRLLAISRRLRNLQNLSIVESRGGELVCCWLGHLRGGLLLSGLLRRFAAVDHRLFADRHRGFPLNEFDFRYANLIASGAPN